MALEPNLTWLPENFEPVRPEALADLERSLFVCRRCGLPVFRYAAAWHLSWHEELVRRTDGADAYYMNVPLVKGEFEAQPEGSSTGCLSSPSQAVQSVQSNDHLA